MLALPGREGIIVDPAQPVSALCVELDSMRASRGHVGSRSKPGLPMTWSVCSRMERSPLPISLIVFWTTILGAHLDCADPRRSDVVSTTIESSGQITRFMLLWGQPHISRTEKPNAPRADPKSDRSNFPGITQEQLGCRCAEPHSLTANYPACSL